MIKNKLAAQTYYRNEVLYSHINFSIKLLLSEIYRYKETLTASQVSVFRIAALLAIFSQLLVDILTFPLQQLCRNTAVST